MRPGNSSREKRLQKCMSVGFFDNISVESIDFPFLGESKIRISVKIVS